MMTQPQLFPVTRELVPEDQRLAITERIFGIHFPLKLEPVIYGITERMAEDYNGGYWDFYTLSNGGFYISPSSDDTFNVTCDNMFEGDLSADALGITACLYAYSHLSFSNGRFARVCACHYHRLREYMFEHPDPSVTQRYAHLSTKSLQAAADSASEAIGGAMPEST